jgi:hypothetical protein
MTALPDKIAPTVRLRRVWDAAAFRYNSKPGEAAAAMYREAVDIVRELGVEPLPHQIRILQWGSDWEPETLGAFLDLMVAASEVDRG